MKVASSGFIFLLPDISESILTTAPTTDDDFVQPGNLYRLMPSDEQDQLIINLVNSLKNVPEFIQERMVKHFFKAESTWGERVAKELGIEISPALAA